MDPLLNVVPLPAAQQEATFGGKAVSLGAALRAGLPVPPGVAIGAGVVDRIASGDAEALRAVVAHPQLPGGRLAVRSSAVGEDSTGASFAGQHATVLNVRPEQIADAVAAVWQSGRSEAALAYRARKGIHAAPAVGVVIQALVEPIAAGVLFTRHPLSGADERLIEAAWGLGEAVVSGLVSPDQYRLAADGRVIERVPGCKDVQIWYDGEHGTTEVAVPAERHHVLCLDDRQLARLHALAERCRATWRTELDLEWALGTDDAIYLLQSRPITTLPGA
jgi:pyruvate, water dikinase